MFERYHEIMERRDSDEATESGFTLIELLIVIVVLGILAAIVVFSLTGVSGQSKQAACTSDAKSVEIAADAYQAANNGDAPAADQQLGRPTLHGLRTCTRCRHDQRLHDQSRHDHGCVRWTVGPATRRADGRHRWLRSS